MTIKTYPRLSSKIEALLEEIQRQKDYIQRTERALLPKNGARKNGDFPSSGRVRLHREQKALVLS